MNECTKYHPDKMSGRNADENDVDDGDDDAGLLDQRAGEISDVVPLEPKRRQRRDKPHPKVAATKHDNGTQKAKKASCN